jgi:2-desacetyl-2-hydroxyethyl bacteriochlorophyllide A dehydrogenase
MRTVELVAPERLQLTERADPEPGPEEVRIAVSTVGVCGTDMEFYRGRRSAGYPFVLGHECAGRIDALGAGVTDWEIGSPVTVRPNFGCGTCPLCTEGRDNLCPGGRGLGVTIDGCLSEYIVAPACYVWPVPEGMDLETAALIEPAAVAERAVCRAGSIAGRRLLVLGAGSIGLLTLQIAAVAGAEVTVVDPIVSRRRRALDLGAANALASSSEAGRERFDVVIETAGVPEAVNAAIEHARPGGWIVLTGIPMDPAAIETKWVVWRELKLIGSFIYEASDFACASDRIARGEIRALDLVTDRFPLVRAAEAFRRAADRQGLKVLITIREEEC